MMPRTQRDGREVRRLLPSPPGTQDVRVGRRRRTSRPSRCVLGIIGRSWIHTTFSARRIFTCAWDCPARALVGIAESILAATRVPHPTLFILVKVRKLG